MMMGGKATLVLALVALSLAVEMIQADDDSGYGYIYGSDYAPAGLAPPAPDKPTKGHDEPSPSYKPPPSSAAGGDKHKRRPKPTTPPTYTPRADNPTPPTYAPQPYEPPRRLLPPATAYTPSLKPKPIPTKPLTHTPKPASPTLNKPTLPRYTPGFNPPTLKPRGPSPPRYTPGFNPPALKPRGPSPPRYTPSAKPPSTDSVNSRADAAGLHGAEPKASPTQLSSSSYTLPAHRRRPPPYYN